MIYVEVVLNSVSSYVQGGREGFICATQGNFENFENFINFISELKPENFVIFNNIYVKSLCSPSKGIFVDPSTSIEDKTWCLVPYNHPGLTPVVQTSLQSMAIPKLAIYSICECDQELVNKLIQIGNSIKKEV